MEKKKFDKKLRKLFADHNKLITRKNKKQKGGNGIYDRYIYPILTRDHAPVFWQYDLNYETNPHLMMRLGVNTTFNAGAIRFNGKYLMVVRTEGFDVKSIFAVAESPNGIDNWKFWDHPIVMPVTDNPEKNVYDMRLTQHEDGWIYGLFCAERKDPEKPEDSSAALASCGIAPPKTWLTGNAFRFAINRHAATQLRTAPRICRRQIHDLYPSAKRVH
jgi:4-O-beta-D-mannosyl-D-glucose phosphorylase